MTRRARFTWPILAMLVAMPVSAKPTPQSEGRLDLDDAPPAPAFQMVDEPRGAVVPRSTVSGHDDGFFANVPLLRQVYAYQERLWDPLAIIAARSGCGGRYVPRAIHNVPADVGSGRWRAFDEAADSGGREAQPGAVSVDADRPACVAGASLLRAAPAYSPPRRAGGLGKALVARTRLHPGELSPDFATWPEHGLQLHTPRREMVSRPSMV